MSIKLTPEALRDPQLQRGMLKLRSFSAYKKIATACAVADLCTEMEKFLGNDPEFDAAVKKYAAHDDYGMLVPFDGKSGTFQIPEEHHAAWAEEMTRLNSKELVINQPPLFMQDLEGVPLAPAEIAALGPIISRATPLRPV